MKLLLDTHTFLWLVEGSPNLSAAAKAALADPANELFLSAASVWELAIKVGNKKLTLSDPLDVYVAKWPATYQLAPLPVQFAHAQAIANLPPHHKDPFDRLLVAPAALEGMSVVTSDAKFAPYGVPIVLVRSAIRVNRRSILTKGVALVRHIGTERPQLPRREPQEKPGLGLSRCRQLLAIDRGSGEGNPPTAPEARQGSG